MVVLVSRAGIFCLKSVCDATTVEEKRRFDFKDAMMEMIDIFAGDDD